MNVRTTVSSGMLLALVVSLAGAQGSRIRVPVTVDTLPNGLTLIVNEDHSVPMVATNVWFHVGSGDEKPGRTGFAHLFEHLMFMGSEHAPYPQFDRLLEAAGASNNGTTSEDRTSYYEWGPSSALAMMLWLEADRMGWLLSTMDAPKVDLQRDVVKNERRQRVDNAPYGVDTDILPGAIYPKDHPYSWPAIGSMTDLSAASLDDVKAFFRRYYAPNDASIVVSGDVKADSVRRLVTAYFSGIPRGPAITRPAPAPYALRDTNIVAEDRVQLPRIYLAWHTIKAYSEDDPALDIVAYLLTGARNSRLTNSLVYEREIARDVVAGDDSKRLDGDFYVIATARPGQVLDSLRTAIDRELRRLADDGPTSRELEQAKNSREASFLNRLESVNGKAEQLNAYYYYTGKPDGFQAELDRLRAVSAADVKRVVQTYLLKPRVTLSIVPLGRRDLAATRGTIQ
jgi:zinc protease